MSKRKKRCFSSLLPPFLSTLLLPYARTRAPTDRKHCFHSFINLAEGNIYRRIHGCIHSRPRFMRPYPFLHTRPHWNWFRPGPMGYASTATGKINTRPLSFPVFFFNQGSLFEEKNTLYLRVLQHFLINRRINRVMPKCKFESKGKRKDPNR